MDATRPLPLDDADRAILAALSEDPRMSFAEMARRLRVSAGMVRQRFGRLQEAGAVRIAAITDPLLTGSSLMVMVALKVELGALERACESIASYDEVVYLTVLAGSFDVLLEARFRDHEHLLEFLTARLGAIDGIRESETFTSLRIVKETYF